MGRSKLIQNRGFSLVELLVVMGIITMLVSIIVPVSIQSRNRARASVCLSNLRQLGTAISMYATDYDERLLYAPEPPFAGSWRTPEYPDGTGSTRMRKSLQSYTKSQGVFNCPSDHGAPAFGFKGEREVWKSAGTSYVWNPARTDSGWLVNGASLYSLDPSTILLHDYGSNWHGVRLRHGVQIVEHAHTHALYADGHSAPITALTLERNSGQYVAFIMNQMANSTGNFWVAGTTDYGSAYVYGLLKPTPDSETGSEVVVNAYGTIYSDAGDQEIYRTFVYGPGISSQTIINQIVSWIESLVSH